MVEVVKFENDDVSYGESKEEKLRRWTKGMDRKEIISVTYNENEIILFYWSE